ncbi:VWA domain-containing protein [Streptomyces sp. NBC_01669]|uniref:VWA domain-containing protein n=1 Tax=Streptomyces sp. NBC_01669 TaxID=2975909 RepID=UPI00225A7008|nr:VWA domain-containing protein [Streptomyces sp. NBC_01669]MCX4538196.1 VWA domain-containing protein [Streptomyces sp. NBC_01669]
MLGLLVADHPDDGSGLAGQRAAVYLVLDHDWHMEELYESFAVQAFAERVLALSVNLDDDGMVPVIFSSGREPFLEEIRLDNYRGRIGSCTHRSTGAVATWPMPCAGR